MAVAAAAFVLNYVSGTGDAPEQEVASAQSKAPDAPKGIARDTGIPVPSPPPVAAFKPGDPDKPAKQPAEPKKSPAAEEKPMTAVAKMRAIKDEVVRALKAPFEPSAKPEAEAAKPEPSRPQEAKAEPQQPGDLAPSFDVVRVNPQGDAVIAGRAAPGATVSIYDGGKLSGTVVADGRGDWVYLPTTPLPSGKRELSLSVKTADGGDIRSESVVVLMVPERGADVAKAAKPEEQGALAVLVPRDGKTPSKVLQKPVEPKGVGDKKLSIDVVDYDDKGSVKVGGRGKPGAGVQVYVDNKLVGRSQVDKKGDWNVGAEKPVEPGLHKLRVDAVTQGKVMSRVEIPFARAQPVSASQEDSLVVVQPGNSLWRIARRTLGEGMRYTEIYNSNRAKIVDPDLIYPGQVFLLPETH